MNYRHIPRCDFHVSEIGLGGEHLEKKDKSLVEEVMGTALDGGINIMDVFMPQPEVRTHIGDAIRHARQKFHLQGHIGATLENGQYKRSRDVSVCDAFVRDFLTRFHTDYIDIGMIHFVDDLDDWHTIENQGILEYALQLKQKGIIRAIGLSSHVPNVAMKAVQSGQIDVLMFSVNPLFDLLPEQTPIDDLFEQKTYEHGASSGINPSRQELYETCARLGVGITVMKTLGAGLLLGADSSPFGQPMTVAQCEHYALTRPAVASVLIGCVSSEQVHQALQYESLSAQEKDYTAVLNTSQRYSANGACMYCNHCLPCPQEIDIAAVHQYYDLARSLSEVPATVREHYLALHAHASDCIACGACEERCPFDVEVIQNMEKARALFGI
ncbi:MAG TPA: aldo/keto reductase [Anaerolineaceae bacterium]|nr:aldo/keto reductase [Anaerolineaceae bacterium]